MINLKILVIGNGFDLEHGLPTKYKDFLDFMQCINFLENNLNIIERFDISESYFEVNLEVEVKHAVDDNVKKYFYDKKLLNYSSFNKWKEKEISKELVKYAGNNIWIKYFIENMNYEKEGWIDLESEISNVIKCFDYMKNISKYYEKYYQLPENIDDYKEEIVQKILDYSEFEINGYELIDTNLKQIIKVLNKHLKNLIRCLEIYLEDCVKKIEIRYISPDIKGIYFDKVLSFNYTNTYEIKYGLNFDYDSEQYDYIHGKANMNRRKEKNNMVLGIDEYLDDDRKSNELDFIEFKKYFQRIYKRTGKDYKKWICEKDKNEIYIFGHSLDVTDKDILIELIEHENTITTIFYCNKSVYAQQISNLVKIIGSDELTRKVSGENPTIIFKQQQVKRKSIEKDLVEEQLYYLVMSCIYKNSKGLTDTEIQNELGANIKLLNKSKRKFDLAKIFGELNDFYALKFSETEKKWIKANNFDICFEDSIMEMCDLFDIEEVYEGEKKYQYSHPDTIDENILYMDNLLNLIQVVREFEVF